MRIVLSSGHESAALTVVKICPKPSSISSHGNPHLWYILDEVLTEIKSLWLLIHWGDSDVILFTKVSPPPCWRYTVMQQCDFENVRNACQLLNTELHTGRNTRSANSSAAVHTFVVVYLWYIVAVCVMCCFGQIKNNNKNNNTRLSKLST